MKILSFKFSRILRFFVRTCCNSFLFSFLFTFLLSYIYAPPIVIQAYMEETFQQHPNQTELPPKPDDVHITNINTTTGETFEFPPEEEDQTPPPTPPPPSPAHKQQGQKQQQQEPQQPQATTPKPSIPAPPTPPTPATPTPPSPPPVLDKSTEEMVQKMEARERAKNLAAHDSLQLRISLLFMELIDWELRYTQWAQRFSDSYPYPDEGNIGILIPTTLIKSLAQTAAGLGLWANAKSVDDLVNKLNPKQMKLIDKEIANSTAQIKDIKSRAFREISHFLEAATPTEVLDQPTISQDAEAYQFLKQRMQELTEQKNQFVRAAKLNPRSMNKTLRWIHLDTLKAFKIAGRGGMYLGGFALLAEIIPGDILLFVPPMKLDQMREVTNHYITETTLLLDAYEELHANKKSEEN